MISLPLVVAAFVVVCRGPLEPVGAALQSGMVVTGRGVELMTPKEHALTNQLALTQLHTTTLRRRAALVHKEVTSLQEMIATASVSKVRTDSGEWETEVVE